MPFPPPKKKIPQQPPAGAPKPKQPPAPPAGAGTHARPAPPPPAQRPPNAHSAQQAQPPKPDGAEAADASNPNAPSQNQAEAGGPGNNTTNPNDQAQPAAEPPKPVDTGPLRFVIQDEPGMSDHGWASQGIEPLHALMLGVQGLHEQSPPEVREQMGTAAMHLGDAYRQANFGQHEGAVTSIGHAAGALDRARQVPGQEDGEFAGKVGDAYDTAVGVGNAIRQGNDSRPPWNPLPVKHRGLAVRTVEGKLVFAAGVRAGTSRGRDQERDEHGRFASGGGSGDRSTCESCGARISEVTSGMHAGRYADTDGNVTGDGHYHRP